MNNQPFLIILIFLNSIVFPQLSFAENSLQNQGDFSNIVCFVRFADEANDIFSRDSTYYANLFNNSSSETSNSLFNYYKQISYNKLFIQSHFFPGFNNEIVVSFQDSDPRGYYQPYSESNPAGYSNEIVKAVREQTLIKRAVQGISSYLPEDIITDANQDGFVDNVCVIISGSYDGNGDLLWPHYSTLLTETYMNDKRVNGYVMLFADKLDNGVLCHETMHCFGAPDLYHSNKMKPTPIGNWDLMSDNMPVPQGMLAYTKYKYGKWIDSIPEITEAGVYTLYPVNEPASRQVAYKIKPTQNSDEYFVLEYRRKKGLFEGNLSEAGLLIYRVNEKLYGNASYNGTTRLDEIYIFRPGGTVSEEGDLKKATFSEESGRTSFSPSTDPYPFFSNGSKAYFNIKNISSCNDSIRFELEAIPPVIEVTPDKVSLMCSTGRTSEVIISSSIPWKILSVPEYLEVTPEKGEGPATIRIVTKEENLSEEDLNYTLEIVAENNPETKTTVEVTQRGKRIDSPNNLSYTKDGNSVFLKWDAPNAGNSLFEEDFEDNNALNQWSIESLNNIGWKRESNYPVAKDGYYSFKLNYDYEHQDEWLISPAFKNGSVLTFYSHSIGSGKPTKDKYTVNVSSDGGQTWHVIWDLVEESSLINRFERVNLDLSPYKSENMKIGFHGVDFSNIGISYPWTVDAISIYGENPASLVYRIFRNGTFLAETSDLFYSDIISENGKYTYTISAKYDNIETPYSDPLEIVIENMSINEKNMDFELDIYPNPVTSKCIIDSKNTISSVTIFNSIGFKTSELKLPDLNRVEIDMGDLPKGIYILIIKTKNSQYSVIKKIIKR